MHTLGSLLLLLDHHVGRTFPVCRTLTVFVFTGTYNFIQVINLPPPSLPSRIYYNETLKPFIFEHNNQCQGLVTSQGSFRVLHIATISRNLMIECYAKFIGGGACVGIMISNRMKYI